MLPNLKMISAISPQAFKGILKKHTFHKNDSVKHSCNSKPEIEPFPFFNLPELVIVKIIKEYMPVTDKMGALSKIPEFQHYLESKALWFQPSLQLFQLVGFIQPGWYVNCSNLHLLYYVNVNYYDLSFTVHHFDVRDHQTRIPVKCNKFKNPYFEIPSDVIRDYFSLILIEEKNFFVYKYKECCRYVYFWIFRSQKIIRCSQSPKLYQLKNNKCSIMDKLFSSLNIRRYILTFNEDDCTLLIKCQTRQNVYSQNLSVLYNWRFHSCAIGYYSGHIGLDNQPEDGSVLYPLHFQPCAEMGSDEFNNEIAECKTCKKGPNCIHTVFKETYVDFDKDTSAIVDTIYFKSSELL